MHPTCHARVPLVPPLYIFRSKNANVLFGIHLRVATRARILSAPDMQIVIARY